MLLGIPRAFLYYRYRTLWESFFDALDIDYIISRKTDKGIMDRGTMLAIDEACLSTKIYLGHVDALIGECDRIFVPRIANYGRGKELCTKFSALYDIVLNTFHDEKPDVLDYNLDVRNSNGEMSAFYELGGKLGKKRAQIIAAYSISKQAEKMDTMDAIRVQNALLEKQGMKLLVVGHGYNVYDEYIGVPVLKYLKELGATPIIADTVDRKLAMELSDQLTETMPWIYNRELLGAVQYYREDVDGIILLTSFPCGPDSLANETIIRRVKDLPILNLLMDGQSGSAGVETRLESFVDIIRFRQEDRVG